MKQYRIYLIWGALFIVCAGFGFIQEPQGALKVLLVLLSAGFFVPGGILLYQGYRDGEKKKLRLVRNLSLLSLGLTMAAMAANVLSVYMSETMGVILTAVWIIVSAPAVCSQYGIVSVFAWACLLMTSLSLLRKNKDE